MGTQPSSDLALARRIVAALPEPLLVLDEDLRVRAANPAFLRTFATEPEATEGGRLPELGDGGWDVPELGERLDRVSDEGASFPFTLGLRSPEAA